MTPATFDTGYLRDQHWLSWHWLPATGYLTLAIHKANTGYPTFATPTLATFRLLPIPNRKYFVIFPFGGLVSPNLFPFLNIELLFFKIEGLVSSSNCSQ